jgi:hypothetical protein
MNQRTLFRTGLVGLLLTGLPAGPFQAPGRAQGFRDAYEPHVPIPEGEANRARPEEKLADFMRRNEGLTEQDKKDLSEAIKAGKPFTEAQKKTIAELVRPKGFSQEVVSRLLDNPEFLKLLQAAITDPSKAKVPSGLPAGLPKDMSKLVEDWMKAKPGASPRPPATPATPPAPPPVASRREAVAPPKPPPGPPPVVRGTGPTKDFARWIIRMAETLKKQPGPLRDSPAVNKALGELARQAANAVNGRAAEGPAGAPSNWPQFSNALPKSPAWKDALPSSLRAWKWPALSDWKLPKVNVRGDWGARPRQGSQSPARGANTPSAPSRGPGLDELAVALIGILALAVLFAGWRRRRPASAPLAHGLGPWPVQPSRVRTADEVVRAFEYLALRDLGPAARSWHHRLLADGLGKGQEKRLGAARGLARVYEQVRYSPRSQPLAAEAVARARRDLCFLAGVPAT